MRKRFWLGAGVLGCLAAATAVVISTAAPQTVTPESVIVDIRKSHINGNVPDAAVFDAYMTRDLKAYFVANGMSEPTVTYDLFRKEPTQSGVAAPKFYVWAIARGSNGEARAGAVRLAAVERQEFAVTDFVSRETIIADPDAIASVFPAALLAAIKARASQQ